LPLLVTPCPPMSIHCAHTRASQISIPPFSQQSSVNCMAKPTLIEFNVLSIMHLCPNVKPNRGTRVQLRGATKGHNDLASTQELYIPLIIVLLCPSVKPSEAPVFKFGAQPRLQHRNSKFKKQLAQCHK